MVAIPLTVDKESFTSINLVGLPPAQRFDFWSNVICANFSPAENSIEIAPREFDASLKGRYLGSVGVCKVVSAPMVSTRTTQSIRRDPLDSFFVSLLTSGEAHLSQYGRQTIQRAGEFVMYDSSVPFCYEMTSNYNGYWLKLPRQAVSTRLANAETLTARVLTSASPVGRLLINMVSDAFELELKGNMPASARIANSILDVLAAAYDTALDKESFDTPRHANLLDYAKSYILSNLDAPGLNLELLVDALGVSPRTLNRLFAHEGTTPIRWLWQQRLVRGKTMLESGAETRVTDVAMACGFNNFSHFSRAFKAEFGMTPKDCLSGRH